MREYRILIDYERAEDTFGIDEAEGELRDLMVAIRRLLRYGPFEYDLQEVDV